MLRHTPVCKPACLCPQQAVDTVSKSLEEVRSQGWREYLWKELMEEKKKKLWLLFRLTQ